MFKILFFIYFCVHLNKINKNYDRVKENIYIKISFVSFSLFKSINFSYRVIFFKPTTYISPILNIKIRLFLHRLMSLCNLIDLMTLRCFDLDIFRLPVGLGIDMSVLNFERNLLI